MARRQETGGIDLWPVAKWSESIEKDLQSNCKGYCRYADVACDQCSGARLVT